MSFVSPQLGGVLCQPSALRLSVCGGSGTRVATTAEAPLPTLEVVVIRVWRSLSYQSDAAVLRTDPLTLAGRSIV